MTLQGQEDDHDLVRRLEAEEGPAWEDVYRLSVLPVLKQVTKNGVPYSRILRDRGLNGLSVLAMLYEEMVFRKKLKNFGFRCPVVFWLRFYVKKAILAYCGKNEQPVSDSGPEAVSSYESRAGDWEWVQECFAALWRSNPMRAYVYLLRRGEGMPAGDAAAVLGISPANVDQCFARAKRDMRALLERRGEGGE